MDIYSIGHSNYSVDKFLNMLKIYNINCVADIRGTPYSKYNVQYNKETIKQTLTEQGILYVYMGKEFAVQRENKSLYTEEGYADFEKVVYDPDFLSGIERLKAGCRKGYRIALMGAMQDPIRCHRCILLGRALLQNNFVLKHILDEDSLATQEELEERLLQKFYSHANQITFDTILKGEPSKEDRIRNCYKKSNREIGYRVELGKNIEKNSL